MGREIKRVALDFDGLLHQVWEGYVNPHYRACPDCEAGSVDVYWAIHKHIAGLLWDTENLRKHPRYAQITEYLADRAYGFGGHDSIDAWLAVKKLGELAGLPKGWHTCPTCNGGGLDPSIAEAYEAWERRDPPRGEGWQVWETVSEGSPISPVFATKEEMVTWLEGRGYSRLAAERFAEDAWAPSATFVDGVWRNDIESCAVE